MPSTQERSRAKMRKSCANKTKHKTIGAAQHHTRHLDKKGVFVKPYECPICKGWHVCKRDPVQTVYALLDKIKKEK